MRPYLVGNFFVKRISFWETRVIKGVTVIETNGKSFFNIFNPQDFNGDLFLILLLNTFL